MERYAFTSPNNVLEGDLVKRWRAFLGASRPAFGVQENHFFKRRKPAMTVKPHDRFSSEVTLTPPAVTAFAQAVGDHNPLHYDPAYVARTRYKRLVASGTQTTSLLMALTATYFSQQGAMVGLEFWFRFRRPVFADETIRLEWLVVSVKAHPRLGGDLVDLRGRIRNAAGETTVGAKGRVLVAEQW